MLDVEINQDKAGKEYWDDVWEGSPMSDLVDPRKPGIRNFSKRKFHSLFQNIFASMETGNKTLLEVGCARSTWLPYFAKEFGFKVTGLDYSEIGCEQERQILVNAEVEGSVECADLFTPPESMLGAFDVVTSFGVAEHFEDTAKCISALAAFLKPGGLLITEIPNMTGAIGSVQKMVNKPVYLAHVPLDHTQLRKAHEKYGLEVLSSDFFMSSHFGVNNLTGMNPRSASSKIKALFLQLLTVFSVSLWALESCGLRFPNTKFLSPYVVCVARNGE